MLLLPLGKTLRHLGVLLLTHGIQYFLDSFLWCWFLVYEPGYLSGWLRVDLSRIDGPFLDRLDDVGQLALLVAIVKFMVAAVFILMRKFLKDPLLMCRTQGIWVCHRF